MKRHIVRAGLTAAAIAGITGCQSKQAPPNVQSAVAPVQQQEPAPVVQAAGPTSGPVEAAAAAGDVGTPEALRFKFEKWASEMEAQMDKRARRAAEPAGAEFLEPDEFHIGMAKPAGAPRQAEPPVRVVPVANPVVDSTPSLPNQGAAIASAAAARASGTDVSKGVSAETPGERWGGARTARDASAGAGGDLEFALAKNLRENPKDVWAQLDFQLLQFLKDEPTPQLDVMAKLPAEDRELVASVMDALTNFRNGLRADNHMLMSRKVRPILELADRVRAQADLVVPTLALCTEVRGFGIYEPIEPARFAAMREHEVIVYCEVANFASHQNANKQWETKLSQEVVLYTETGLPVWQDKTESIADLARNRRHDFFVVKKTKFPANITLGRYLLKVTVVDQQANRVAEATVPVQFVAQ